MKTSDAPSHRPTRLAWSTALAMAMAVSAPNLAHADRVKPPTVPVDLQAPVGTKAFLKGHGVGTQNYVCLPCPNPTTPAASCPDDSGFAWLLFTPEATLFSANDKQLTTHFFSPNPSENGTIRATWQDSRDTSTVWAKLIHSSSDSNFVEAGAVPWLSLAVVPPPDGASGHGTLTPTTFIQRLNTHGGVAPSTGCAGLEDVGAKAFRPYSADYFFYKNDAHHEEAARRRGAGRHRPSRSPRAAGRSRFAPRTPSSS
jgi:uncharacterized protein DUF3455